MIKRTIFCSGWERTGPVNLAFWRVPMTRSFTDHKPRGMRESRKWATVSIFCQTALRLLSLSFPAFCVHACVSVIHIITSSSLIPISCLVYVVSVFVSKVLSVFLTLIINTRTPHDNDPD